MERIETIEVNNELLDEIKSAIDAALAYEKATKGKRKLGITGEVGELLACHQLGLRLVVDSRSEGYDAIDRENKRVQIKTRRSETEGLPRDVGTVSSFSNHAFDYAILVILDREYRIAEIWRADYDKLLPLIHKRKRRDPNISSFKKAGKRIYPNQP